MPSTAVGGTIFMPSPWIRGPCTWKAAYGDVHPCRSRSTWEYDRHATL